MMTGKKAKIQSKKNKLPTNYEITTDNIFNDLGLEQSDELLTRANLLNQVSSLIKESGLSQAEVAIKLDITQPQVSLLVRGRLSAFSTDILLLYLSILGCNVQIKVSRPRTRKGIFGDRGKIAVRSTKSIVKAKAKPHLRKGRLKTAASK